VTRPAEANPFPVDVLASPAFGRATRVEIDLGALRHNLTVARAAAPGSRVMAAIKANGYGHGLQRVARALAQADAFGVACINEALELRRSGIRQPIVLLEGFFHADELPLIGSNGLETVIHRPGQLEALEAYRGRPPLRVWIKVDSGMHRLGFPPETVAAVHARLLACAGVEFAGFVTHLANADDRQDPKTRSQLDTFAAATGGLPGLRSIANSAGVLGWPASHGDWVRPGVMLYGVSPFCAGSGGQHDLRPVMTLRSELIAVNRLDAGATVGYGGSWRCPEAMPVGVVAVGYGDGYPRHAAPGTPVLVNGRRVPLIGRVSMDMITVDLRSQPDAAVGAPAVLWGDGLPVEQVADQAGTIAYELLCGVTQRVRCIEVDG
jgi:alanine racemase